MKFLILVSALFSAVSVLSQDNNRQLRELLDERKQKAGMYLERIEKKTGIFGNQSKKDLKEANAILTQVVETDNRIFKEAERIITHSNFETSSAGKDLAICIQQKEELLKTIKNMQAPDEKGNTSIRRTHVPAWMKWVLALTVIYATVMTYLFIRKQKAIQ